MNITPTTVHYTFKKSRQLLYCSPTYAAYDGADRKGHHPARGRAGQGVDEGRIPHGYHVNRHRIQGNHRAVPHLFRQGCRIYGNRPDSRRVRSMYGPRGRRGLEAHRSGKTSEECQRQQQRCHRGWLLLTGVFPPKDVVETIGQYRVPLQGPRRPRSEISESNMTSHTICDGGGCFD
jgi:hypothetical protein